MSGAVAPGDDLVSMEMGASGVKPADVPAEIPRGLSARGNALGVTWKTH